MTRKTRRISYAKKAKQQRMNLYIILTVVAILFASCLAPLADDGSHQITVIAMPGDTLWAICEEHKPEGTSLRNFIDEVMKLNEMRRPSLAIGQKILIPVD